MIADARRSITKNDPEDIKPQEVLIELDVNEKLPVVGPEVAIVDGNVEFDDIEGKNLTLN